MREEEGSGWVRVGNGRKGIGRRYATHFEFLQAWTCLSGTLWSMQVRLLKIQTLAMCIFCVLPAYMGNVMYFDFSVFFEPSSLNLLGCCHISNFSHLLTPHILRYVFCLPSLVQSSCQGGLLGTTKVLYIIYRER